MNWDHPDPFTMPMSPRPQEIDGLRHTNNAVYLQWCEQVAWAHSESLGLALVDYQRLDRAMAIAHATYDYLRPARLGDELLLGTWLVASDGRVSMRRAFQLLHRHDGATVMRGHWDLVCIELSSGRPRRMPPAFSDAYLAALVPAAAEGGLT